MNTWPLRFPHASSHRNHVRFDSDHPLGQLARVAGSLQNGKVVPNDNDAHSLRPVGHVDQGHHSVSERVNSVVVTVLQPSRSSRSYARRGLPPFRHYMSGIR
jgi:hypothetical protein